MCSLVHVFLGLDVGRITDVLVMKSKNNKAMRAELVLVFEIWMSFFTFIALGKIR